MVYTGIIKNQFLNENRIPRNSIELFYSRLWLTFMKHAILTLHEKHNIKGKWPNIRVRNKSTSVEKY